MLEIRHAEAEDYEAVKELETFVFHLHQQARPDYFQASGEGYSKHGFEKLLSLPCPIAWVAIEDHRIVGLCFGKIEETAGNSFCKARRVAEIEDLVTLPAYQGHGVATALMAKAREQAAAEQAETLELCVWSFNEKAIRFYERMGMRIQYCRMEERM